MDLLANIPSWDDIERNLDDKFNTLNQAYSDGLQSTYDSWNGFTRRVNTTATQAYGYMGGNRIDYVKAAMRLSYPIIESNLKRKWASIEIEQILPVLLQLVKEVAMILGGSVAVGTVAGGVAGAFFFGVGAVPVAAVGAGIGLQVGNLILMALGLSAIAEYFYKGLPACLSTLQEGFATAWHADEGLKPEGLDPTGGSAYEIQERIDRAARQIAKGQEQLVLLLFTAIVTYMTRGQVKAGIIGSVDSIAARSAKLQADISNKQFANWLARNEQKLLAQPELRVDGPTPLAKSEAPEMPERRKTSEQPAETKKPPIPPPVMSLKDAVGQQTAERWITNGRQIANEADPKRSMLLTDDQIGALHGYTTNEGYVWINQALRGDAPLTPQMEAFVAHATEGLGKLPPYTAGKTFRGTSLPPNVLEKIKMGSSTSDSAFFSTSAMPEKAFNGNVRIEVKGLSGRDVSFLSGHAEAEVLYPPGTQFQVLNRIESGSTTHISYQEIL
ncbi:MULTISPECIES: DUF6861 domain-containing protein [Pseudomonas syringae group]|uniref:NAD(+)--protein-arginine ADP-ribosyltransferase n=4 Tax=Pseudomonas syringae group TaxID=136849 RepID=A0A7Z6U4S8_PSESF|nr:MULTISPECIES: ADP-ribosyltransferase [Pseudomonas syringae group]QXW44902.1 hypothetical protein KXJ79_25230 [Pseudomonas amygdali]RMP77785.1 hypothetical protein ALQ15_200023 [Pseudomonas syringae pv. actinidiae]